MRTNTFRTNGARNCAICIGLLNENNCAEVKKKAFVECVIDATQKPWPPT